VEPVYTFRAHRGAVLSLDISPVGDYVFSGGQDATIRVWNMPNPNVDPYDAYDPAVLATTLTGTNTSFTHSKNVFYMKLPSS
jgi:striatin 1/3/4